MSTPKSGKGNAGAAATHSGGMRAEAKKTRVVFKNVLDTPFNIPWPEVTSENNAIVLDVLCDLMKPIREYRRSGRKTKSNTEKVDSTAVPGASNLSTAPHSSVKDNAAKSSKPKRALAVTHHDPQQPQSIINTKELQLTEMKSTPTEPPVILESTTIGLNAVTKSLERSIRDLRSYPPPKVVFLCKGDLAPSHLYNHLGPMIATLPNTTLLFPLLKGSEKKLSEALGMQAVGALAIHAQTKGAGATDAGSISRETEDLIMILGRMVEPMSVSWLPKALPPPLPKVDKSKKDTSKDPTLSTPAPAATTKENTLSSTSPPVVSAFASHPTSTTATPLIHPELNSTSTASSATAAAAKDETSVKWIPTNIKSVQTTMPIIVKTPRPAPGDALNNSSDNGKKKGSNQQQKQQQQSKSQNQEQKQKQQQPRQKQDQADQSSKKHRLNDDASRGDLDKGKKPRNT
ncbi:hypothetical protein BGZ72_002361 [Mortierella alpina]|nr:hypothetical protein BGZ72_002361 [Mortierella alpina]